MAEDLIRYDIVIQDALRGAVRKILAEAVRAGLPGEHHFYIAFDTTAPGVRISQRLRERYPKEMTIVLQHQFWDLTVTEHLFEVGLSFGGIPEKLSIPFSAIKGFFDPSVQFALEFEPGKTAEELPAELREAVAESAAAETAVESIKSASPAQEPGKDADGRRPVVAAKTEKPKMPAPAPKEAAAAQKDAPGGADVVSLDAFRKKT